MFLDDEWAGPGNDAAGDPWPDDPAAYAVADGIEHDEPGTGLIPLPEDVGDSDPHDAQTGWMGAVR